MQAASSSQVFPLSPRLRLGVGLLLLVSFICNVTALLIPFMDLRIGLRETPYRLTNTISMMWDKGLHVLAVLVIAFSVVFPFAKLAVLAWVCARPAMGATGRRWLHEVERLGKWSMLDVFLVCIILTLTTDQFFVGARPLAGIPVFTLAIMLSMLSGELLSHAAGLNRPAAEPAVVHGRARLRLDGCLLALAGLALLGALTFPFLQISDWKLADRGYSIVTLGGTLIRQGGVFPALINAAFLIVAPLAGWWLTARWWLGLRQGRRMPLIVPRLQLLNRWSMLDVFGLALAIFAVEGEYLMKTEVRWGALFLVALLALQRTLLGNLTAKAASGKGGPT